MATLRNIADHVGISVSTASMAVRDHGAISMETKRRVWEAQEKLGYRPHMRRRTVQANGNALNGEKEIENIAFVLIDRELDDPGGYGRLFQNVTAEGHGRNWRTSLVSVSLETLRQGCIPELLRDGKIKGMVVAGLCDRVAHRHLAKLGVPMVKHGNYLSGDDPWMTCEPDFDHGLRLMMQRLEDFGHSRVGLLVRDTDSEFGQHIREYYLREVAARKFTNVGVSCRMDYPGETAEGMRELLAARPTGVILGHDSFAPDVYDVCEDSGWKIPESLSLVSFGGSGIVLRPRLAQITSEEHGEALVRKLGQLIKNPAQVLTRELFPMRFIPGGSLGSAPDAPVSPPLSKNPTSKRTKTSKKKNP